MTQYEIIDNFLPKKVFNKIYYQFRENDPKVHHPYWMYTPDFSREQIYFAFTIYAGSIVYPHFFDLFASTLEKLKVKALIRIKANCYPKTHEIYEHGMHTDFKWTHKTALFSINTCDGYTKLEDGTKIDSIANRMLLFDGSEDHTSSTCTNQLSRMNVNFSYF